MARVRSLLFPVVVVLATAVLGPLAAAAGLLDRRRSWSLHLAPLWSRVLLAAAGVRVEVRGADNLNPAGAPLFAANHQSNLDVPVLGAVLPHRVLWLAKRELFRVPVFGQALRGLGYIPVDRGDREGARASIAAAAQRLRGGQPVLIFPEGTRSSDGSLGPFKMGVAHLAAASGAPVVPVVVRGTAALCPRGAWSARAGAVSVSFLAPRRLPPGADDAERHRWVGDLRGAIERALAAP